MYFDVIKKMQLKREVERVLHVKGNYKGGILEMAIVLDAALPLEEAKELTKEIAQILKTTDEVFKNVRLNVLYAKTNREIETTVTSLSMLQLGTYFSDKEVIEEEKSFDSIVKHLKKFQARSKLVLVLTKGELPIRDTKRVQDALNPFVKQKTIFMSVVDTKEQKLRIYNGLELYMELIRQ
ncbi:MAG: hypothetical protein IIV45_16545 [Lachnospiraceae bacterium]|nr:hypothetical protein [Lachnospiraceae bacterium]